MNSSCLRIGFVATRLEGTDGVSLEAFKWAQALEEFGHECFYFAGTSDRRAARSRVVAEAHFEHPEVVKISRDLFDDYRRSSATSEAVQELWRSLKRELDAFVADFEIDVLVVENALAMPMNVPLGLALTDLIAQTNIPTIAHHHDFAWERPRFAINAAEDYLQAAFPPSIYPIYNVVINSYAAPELARRTGMSSPRILNVMDFDCPPDEPDEYALTLRDELGIDASEALLLQPTRIVPRKRIERTLELACRLDLPCVVVISHSSGDEGDQYLSYLRDLAARLEVRMILAADRFNLHRGTTPEGRRIYSLADGYQQADLVTYPSSLEGFGNAFLEAIYYRCPLLMSAYEIYRMDIRPKGFEVIEFSDFIDDRTVEKAQAILSNRSRAAAMTEHNYQTAKRHYSYTTLRRRLRVLLDHLTGELYGG